MVTAIITTSFPVISVTQSPVDIDKRENMLGRWRTSANTTTIDTSNWRCLWPPIDRPLIAHTHALLTS